MILNGFYLLTIVEADARRDGLRIAFDVDLEDVVIAKVFSLAPPAMSLRCMLEACGMELESRQIRLDLDTLIGLDCAGLVVGGQIIEFYSLGAGTGWDFMNARLSEVPNYVM